MPIEDAREKRERGEPVEKQRVCPSCRCLISILATKCRYCGEEVGKPKDETRALTSQDLGGETVYHRAPSGSVMDALESFRLEETSAAQFATPPPQTKSVLKRGKGQTPKPRRDDDLPELDAHSQSLAEAVLAPSSSLHSSTSMNKYRATARERAISIGLWVGGLLLAAFGAVKGVDFYQDYQARKAEANRVVVVNRAPAMIASGEAEPIQVLAAAVDALKKEPSSENKQIAEQSLGLVEAQFHDLLNPEQASPPGMWSIEKISEALSLAERAGQLYPNESTARLRRIAEEESSYYRMVLVEVLDTTVKFNIAYPETREIVLGVGDTLDERFHLKGFFDGEAKVEDLHRRDRANRPRVLTFRAGAVRPT